MKISSLETYALSIPYDFGAPPKGFGGEDWTALSIVLVKLQTEDGITGWGEAFSYNCVEAVTAAIDNMVAPLVVGQQVDDIEAFSHSLQRKLHLFGRYGITMFAISGVDTALWDLRAKREGKPLALVLSDRPEVKIEAYASLFRYEDADVVAERAHAAMSEGYTHVKLHEVGLKEMRAARDSIPGVPMMLDVNCPWTEEEASALTPALRDLEPFWVEEPLFPPEDCAALARFGQSSGLALAAGENACTRIEFQRMIDADAVSYYQPSVTKVGGVSESVAIGAICNAAGRRLMPHSPYFGPGFLATLQLAAANPSPVLLERFYAKGEASLYGDWIDPEGGYFKVPNGPGLGVEPDEDVLRTYRMPR